MKITTFLQRALTAALFVAAGAALAQSAPAASTQTAPAVAATPAAPAAAPPAPAGAAVGVPPMERHFAELVARFAPFDIAGQHLGFVSSEVGGRVVKGAPYSAEAISESVQVLADGNRIVRKSATRLARDSEGRTRQERMGSDGQVTSVFINDPVANKRWMLSPARKSATELRGMPAPLPPHAASAEEMRSWGDQMRSWANEWARDVGSRFRGEETRTEQSTNGTSVTRVVRNDGDRKEIEVRVVRIGDPNAPLPPAPPPPSPPSAPPAPPAPPAAPGAAPLPPVPPVPPPPMAVPLPMLPPPGEGVSTALGSKTFDGVRADGTRTTWTIPAGRIGNEKPIEIVSERWYSPELMLVVSSTHRDPRNGESTYRLANLKRGEPDAGLFTVPAEYQQRSGSEVRIEKKIERK